MLQELFVCSVMGNLRAYKFCSPCLWLLSFCPAGFLVAALGTTPGARVIGDWDGHGPGTDRDGWKTNGMEDGADWERMGEV